MRSQNDIFGPVGIIVTGVDPQALGINANFLRESILDFKAYKGNLITIKIELWVHIYPESLMLSGLAIARFGVVKPRGVMRHGT